MDDLELITDRADPGVQRVLDVMKPSRGAIRTALIEDAEPLVQTMGAGVEFIEVFAIATLPVPEALLAACRERNVPLRLVDAGIVNSVFKGEKRPKTFGLARVPRPTRLDALAGLATDVVLLDGVKIVGNIGAIVRTSFALGAGGVVLVDSDLTTVADRRLVRASRGYVFSMPVVLATRDQARYFLEHNAVRPVVFDAGGTVSVAELGTMDDRLVLLLGAEKTGGSDDLSALARDTVSIPMNPAAESLNVSVSAGIALHARAGRNLAPAR